MELKELYEILLSNKPSIEIIKNEDKIFEFIPELKKCKGFNQNNPWHIYDVYDHILHVIDNVPNDITIRLAALFHDIGKPNTYTEDANGIGHFYGHWNESIIIFDNFSKRNSIEKNISESIKKIIFYHDMNIGKFDDKQIKELLKIFDIKEIKMLFELKKSDLLAQNELYHYILKNYNIQEKRIINQYKKEIV